VRIGTKAAAVLPPDRLAAFRACENTARTVFAFDRANAPAPAQPIEAEVEKFKPDPGSASDAADAQL
jgi:hypothetical protein